MVEQKNMPSSFVRPSRLRGSVIALGGAAYRLTKIYRGVPATKFGLMTAAYKGELHCFDLMPQTAFILTHRRECMLFLSHPRLLQHGQKGVIQITARIRSDGPVDGPDRWLEVPADFPDVPSAKDAIRVSARKRVQDVCPSGPLQPLDQVEELILYDRFPRV
jgi:hypothetical protein